MIYYCPSELLPARLRMRQTRLHLVHRRLRKAYRAPRIHFLLQAVGERMRSPFVGASALTLDPARWPDYLRHRWPMSSSEQTNQLTLIIDQAGDRPDGDRPRRRFIPREPGCRLGQSLVHLRFAIPDRERHGIEPASVGRTHREIGERPADRVEAQVGGLRPMHPGADHARPDAPQLTSTCTTPGTAHRPTN